MGFDFPFAIESSKIIIAASGVTLGITLASCLGASCLGLFLELLRRSGRAQRWIAQLSVDFLRTTPALVWLYFLYFSLPHYNVKIPAVAVGVLALSIYFSGYFAEVFRAGIDSVQKGQFEAARALSLTRLQALALVIAPQVLRNIAAPIANCFISIFKATPYLAVIAVPEMLGRAFDIASDTYRYAEPLAAACVLFLLFSTMLSWLTSMVERRMAHAFTQ